MRLASNTTIRSVGCSSASLRAADKPANPAPITTQSAVVFSFSAGRGDGASSNAFHAAGPGSTGRLSTRFKVRSC